MADVRVENHGTIFLFQPLTELGRETIEENAPEDAMYFGTALVVEHRYAIEVARIMIERDGLELE